ncbi:Lrp/AsnC family transcriptional regulator [Balneatrix alpica]|uniref:Lrp/AsnC family transcriptional regulator n=1 Tax=Balneatrix alpica TaxID=75684 RepID=UPI00273930E4|nr:Lrp/AsnC family transcriptional regulator [Balneatrix alpica]
MPSLDKFDQLIINALRANARQSLSAIAEQVNLSRTAVSERLRKLEQQGVIKGYQVLLSQEASEGVSAYIEISYNEIDCADMAARLRQLPEVKLCHGVSGETDMMLLVQTSSMEALQRLREQIVKIPGVGRVKTHVTLAEYIRNL